MTLSRPGAARPDDREVTTNSIDWVRELEAAGWKKAGPNIWESPLGVFFRGPYLAWRVMRGDFKA